MDIISEQCYNQNQSWYFKRYLKHGNTSLFVEICRNAYDHQSYGRVYQWSGTKWELVYSSPIELLTCVTISYVDKEVKPNHFFTDTDTLIDMAVKIIT